MHKVLDRIASSLEYLVRETLKLMNEGADFDIPEFPADLDARYSMMDRWLNAYHGTRRYDLRDPEGLRRLNTLHSGLRPPEFHVI